MALVPAKQAALLTSKQRGLVVPKQFALWTPLNDAKLKYWFDPTSGLTLNGTSVAAWTDRVAGVQVAQSTASNQPGTTTVNGLQALALSSSKQMAGAASALPQPFTFVLAFVMGGGQSSTYTAILDGSAKNGGDGDVRAVVFPHRGDKSNQPCLYAGNNSLISTASSALAANAGVVQCATFNGSSSQNIFNGGAPLTGLGLSTGGISTGFSIGHTDSNQSFNGTLMDVLATTAVDASALNKYQGWMAWRWGLQGNLPTNHPYKSRAPAVSDL